MNRISEPERKTCPSTINQSQTLNDLFDFTCKFPSRSFDPGRRRPSDVTKVRENTMNDDE